jgi:hypothetical protein
MAVIIIAFMFLALFENKNVQVDALMSDEPLKSSAHPEP